MSSMSRSYRFRRRKRVNYKKIGTLLTILAFVIMLFACIRYFSLYNTLRSSGSPTLWRPDSGRVQLLLVGRLEEMVSCTVLSIPSGNEPVHILNVPPLTLAGGDDQVKTIAEIFAQQGVEGTITAIDGLLARELPIDHYVVYDVLAVAEILANLKSVDIQLPAAFQVQYGDTDYVFSEGTNTVSAADAVPILAANSGMDAARFWAEKSLLVEVFNQLFSLQHISYLVTNLSTVSEAYATDMSSRELAQFRDSLQALEWQDLNYLILPGEWVGGEAGKYWSLVPGLVELTVQQIIEDLPAYNREGLIIDVYNANGITGFAAATASQLRKQDYQIGRIANATEESERTVIYYQPDYRLAAMEIAILLEVDAQLIEGSYGSTDNPVAVLLGRDLNGGN